MEWDSCGQNPSGYVAPQSTATTRSRSPSRARQDAATSAARRYRERSRSLPRRDSCTRHGESHGVRSYGTGRSRTGRYHHHQRHGDDESERGRRLETPSERHLGRPAHASRRDGVGIERSPEPWTHNYFWQDRDMANRSGSRYSTSHHCIDSALKQHHNDTGAFSPTPTPPDTHAIRLAPPDTGRHYASHRCHHPSHDHSPSRSTPSPSHSGPHHSSARPPSPPPQPLHKPAVAAAPLPHGARALSRWDFAAFEPLLAHHVERRRGRGRRGGARLADLDEGAARARWREFAAAWNAGRLARAWYEPEMFLRVVRWRVMAGAGAVAADPGVVAPPVTGASGEMGPSVVGGDDATACSGFGDVGGENEDCPDEDGEDEDVVPGPSPLPQIPARPRSEASPDCTLSRQPAITATTTTCKLDPPTPSHQGLTVRLPRLAADSKLLGGGDGADDYRCALGRLWERRRGEREARRG